MKVGCFDERFHSLSQKKGIQSLQGEQIDVEDKQTNLRLLAQLITQPSTQ
jgi:hypothetical protein